MKKTFSFHLSFLSITMGMAAILVSSCSAPYFVANNFKTITADHKTIAIIPIEMHFTGKPPEKLTKEQIDEIEVAESQAFQVSLYNAILRSTNNGKYPMRVNLQHYASTVQLLKEKNIGIRESWQKTPEELCKILGVDAVVKSRIEKEKLMSDLESYGIQLASNIVYELTNYGLWPWFGVSSKSKEISADFSLLNGQDGVTLWSMSFKEGADWRQPSNDIIDRITRRMAINFPYRR